MEITKANGGLPAHTVDAEVLLRERGTLWAALLLGLGAVAFLEVHDRIHVHSRSHWAINATLAGAVFLTALVELVLYPPWVTIGPRGIAFGYWFRRWRFSWAQVDSFAVGNPAHPEHAYVLVRPLGRGGAARAVRLPRLRSHSPARLVAFLQGKQQIHASARAH